MSVEGNARFFRGWKPCEGGPLSPSLLRDSSPPVYKKVSPLPQCTPPRTPELIVFFSIFSHAAPPCVGPRLVSIMKIVHFHQIASFPMYDTNVIISAVIVIYGDALLYAWIISRVRTQWLQEALFAKWYKIYAIYYIWIFNWTMPW